MKSIEGLKHGDKLIDKGDNMVMEYYVWDGDIYLATKKSLFPLSQFDIDNLERYYGDVEAGEILSEAI